MTFEEFKEKYNIRLNEQQSDAARMVERPVLLLAVPGSGKTTTLIARLGYMIECCNIDPSSTLTITYTVASCKDMSSRFADVFGSEMASRVKFQTINSLCMSIIREYVTLTGGKSFNLEPDTSAIVAELYRKVYNEYPDEGTVGEARRLIAYVKNMLMEKEDIESLELGEFSIAPLYDEYQNEMRKKKLMDFDDQLTIAYHILKRYPVILEHFQDRYPYILLDEAQDTSLVQHRIIQLLAARDRNLFMVGDEDQSIYGFRAAFPKALMDFEKVYPEGKVMFLEENFRSTPQIVKAADILISKNSKRKNKKMFSSNDDGKNVNLFTLKNRYVQYKEIQNIAAKRDMQTAILYRNNDSAIPLIYALKKANIPYCCREMDTTFFTHRVVKDVKDFLDFADDPTNQNIFLRIYYKLGLRIKKTEAIDAVNRFNRHSDSSIFDALLRIREGRVSKGFDKKVETFREIKDDNVGNALWKIQYILMNTSRAEDEKFYILRSLVEYNEDKEHFFRKLSALQTMVQEGSKDSKSMLTISTVHASKGLEYDRVIIIDAVDGVLPQADAEDMEEERRIFYVAMTRAKNELLIANYESDSMTFLKDLKTPAPRKMSAVGTKRKDPKKWQTKPAVTLKLKVGDKVCHAKEGSGRITEIDGGILTIAFSNGKRKKFSEQICLEKNLIWKE